MQAYETREMSFAQSIEFIRWFEFTDFPAMEQELWVQNGVCMLPSEY